MKSPVAWKNVPAWFTAAVLALAFFAPLRAISSDSKNSRPVKPDSPGDAAISPPTGAYLAAANFIKEGMLEARIYWASGTLSLAGPDLAGNALTNAVTFAPPMVDIAGRWESIGRILAWNSLTNGLELVQQLSTTNIIARLTFIAPGVMRYQVVNWHGLPVRRTAVIAASKADEHFYGFGEKFDSFDQAGKRVRILTFDQPGDKRDGSYKVVPWFVSTRGYGFNLDTSAESWFDMRASHPDRTVAVSSEPALKFEVFYGPALTNVLSRYTAYVGRPPLPPAWAFAPWLSSDVWRTGGEVRYAVNKYRALGIPGSVFVFDSPWETAYNDFEWNTAQFGASGTYEGTNYDGFKSVSEMMTFLRTNGFKVVCWMTPILNVHSRSDDIKGISLAESPNYVEAATNGYLVCAGQGHRPLIINWWKGLGSPIDFTNPKAQQWLAGQLGNLVAQSGGVIGGFKTDDGESGSGDGNTYIPKDALYSDGRTGVQMQNGYAPAYERTVWNVLGTNGILWARGGFTGSQAYPAAWAGDNQPNFGPNGLAGVVVAGQSAAMSGFAVWGSDICGYLENHWSSTPTNLFERWTQFGALSPVMEMHRQIASNRQYPWSFGAGACQEYRFYAQLHTALFPYLYTYAQQCAAGGLPIIRPLVLMNPSDTNTYEMNHSYLLGDDLLVAAMVTNVATTRAVYLPAGNWYDYFSQQEFAGGRYIVWTNADQTRLPLFVRQGAIIPMISTNVLSLCDAAYVGNTDVTTWNGSLEFLVYPGTNSSFTVYDGTSLQCQTTSFGLTLRLVSKPRMVTLRILSRQPAHVEVDGTPLFQAAHPADLTKSEQGWKYEAPFLIVQFEGAGRPEKIAVQDHR